MIITRRPPVILWVYIRVLIFYIYCLGLCALGKCTLFPGYMIKRDSTIPQLYMNAIVGLGLT